MPYPNASIVAGLLLALGACASTGNGVSLDGGEDAAVKTDAARPDAAVTVQDTRLSAEAGTSQPAEAGTSHDRSLPDATGIANARVAGVIPDDGQDDTAALQALIAQVLGTQERYSSPRFIYLPRGRYDVCGTLEARVGVGGFGNGWRAGFMLVGESRTGTVIRLRDACPGFDNAAVPKPVIATGSERDTPDGDGGGNRAFRHNVMNLTIEVGAGNPGAVGIDYVASNRGTIEDVTIRSPSGEGATGILMVRAWPGPALIKNVTVEGFDRGIRIAHYQYSMTIEHLTLRRQRTAGIVNVQNVLAIRGLVSDNQVPAIVTESEHGQIVLVDSELRGGAAPAAIVNVGRLFARGVRTSGYGMAIDNRAGHKRGATEGNVEEFSSHDHHGLWESPGRSLALPIEETPVVTEVHPDQVVVVKPGEDVQAAVRSGKPVIYLANGVHRLPSTLVIPPGVRKIMGFQSSLNSVQGTTLDPMVRFEGGKDDVTVLEHLRVAGVVEHASPGTLALRHLDHNGYRNSAAGTGKLFLEDIIGKPYVISHPQKVWGRQVNAEFGTAPLIQATNATVWLLGYKTEGEMTVLRATNSNVELLGGLFYPLAAVDPATPMLVNEGGRATYVYSTNGAPQYRIQVRETRNGETRELTRDRISGRGPALYTGP